MFGLKQYSLWRFQNMKLVFNKVSGLKRFLITWVFFGVSQPSRWGKLKKFFKRILLTDFLLLSLTEDAPKLDSNNELVRAWECQRPGLERGQIPFFNIPFWQQKNSVKETEFLTFKFISLPEEYIKFWRYSAE